MFGGFAEPSQRLGLVLRNASTALIGKTETIERVRESVFSSLAVPSDGLLIVFGDALAVRVHRAETVLRERVALIGSFAEPGDGQLIVLGDAFSIPVHEPEPVLRCRVALIGGFAEPGDGFLIVFGNAITVQIYEPEPVLRRRVALIGSFAEPGDGSLIIFGDAIAVLVHKAELVLRNRVALIGRFAKPCGGLLIIFGDAATLQIDVAESVLRDRVALVGSLACPEDVLLIVFDDTFTVRIQHPESELRRRIVLLGSFAVLLRCRRQFVGFLIGSPELVGEAHAVRISQHRILTGRESQSDIHVCKVYAGSFALRIKRIRGILIAIGNDVLRKRARAQNELQNAKECEPYRYRHLQMLGNFRSEDIETVLRGIVNSIVVFPPLPRLTARRFSRHCSAMHRLTIVIPVLDEATIIVGALEALAPLRARGAEVIVVDGGSSDGTPLLAKPLADHVIAARRGRGLPMNAGAALGSGDALLFLHADTALPENADRLIAMALAVRAWGRFDLRIAGRHPLLAVVARMINWRSRLTGIATGDQAIFVTRQAFSAVGGFPDLPLMEDIAISRQLKHLCRPLCISTPVITSGRRWEHHGVLRTIVLMWRLRLAYYFGVAPARLAQRYGRVPPSAAQSLPAQSLPANGRAGP